MDFLQGLNPPQREAVAHTEGPLLILAGAGSGKTRVITHRIAHIITARRVPPPAVLAVTFTNKAANEMRERVAALLADVPLDSEPRISTFHSFCVRLLRRDGDALVRVRPGFTRRFTIYDDEDQLAIIKAAYRALGLDEKDFLQYRAVLSRISSAKNRKEMPEDLYRNAANPESERIAAVWEEYEKALRKANALDFDDLLLEAVRLLRTDDATREAWNRRLSYLMVDEYQDTNRSQYELMRLLSESHNNVCVVGDEDQSIYSWRGSDIRNILDFERDFPNARTIRLEQNYRSTKNILAAAGAVIENNKARKGKKLWTAGQRSGCTPDTMPKTRRCSSPTRWRSTWPPTRTTTWRCSTGLIFNRGRSKRHCGGTGASTTSSAASVSTSGRKSRTWWRT
jgi:DNA helicase II / ATP-dependent DNA helicase PcrA